MSDIDTAATRALADTLDAVVIPELPADASDEQRRLQRAIIDGCNALRPLSDEVDRLRAEVESARFRRDQGYDQRDAALARVAELEAENLMLRRENERLTTANATMRQSEIDALRAVLAAFRGGAQ